MSRPGLPPTGRAAEEAELLSQLGLPTSAAPEDIDQLHQAASEYLASAPASLRGWAHAQAAALDAAYLHLTDPAGFGGSALRSPSRPPAVDPGGPATPPARRGSRPAAAPAPVTAIVGDDTEADDVDLDDLYASVTPSAHSDMGGAAKPRARKAAPIKGAVKVAPAPTIDAAAGKPLKRVAIAGVAIAAALVLLVGVYLFGGGKIGGSGDTGAAASPGQSAPAVDLAKVGALMQKLQANPNDTVTLLALGDEYYAGQDFTTAGSFYDKVLAVDPKNIKALLARGAVSFDLGDLTAALTTWQTVATLEPNNQEVHYDLGFLYLNQASPDWSGVQREWNKVVALDPTTQLAQVVQQHLTQFATASMIPGASGAASPAPSISPATSASPAASPVASTQP